MSLNELLQHPQKLKNHLLVFFLVCLALALLAFFFSDHHLAAWMARKENMSYWLFNREITNIGLSIFYFNLSAGIYIFARWIAPYWQWTRQLPINWAWLRTWGLLFFCCLASSGLVNQLIKLAVGRQRPHVSPDFPTAVFRPFQWHWDWHSFPSGHSQTLFTVVVFFTFLWPKGRYFILVLLSYLSLTRALTHSHFLSDVIMGAAVGYCISLITIKWLLPRYPHFLNETFMKNSETQASIAGL